MSAQSDDPGGTAGSQPSTGVGGRGSPRRAAWLRVGLAALLCAVAVGAAVHQLGAVASWTYLRRLTTWRPSGVDDWRRFPSRAVARAPVPHRYPEDPAGGARLAEALRAVTYPHHGAPRTVDLDGVLAETGTTAFIVLKDGRLLRESYLGGHTRETPCRAFSVSKSITSVLVGLALEQGHLRDLDDPFVRYVPELAGRGYDGITLRHLLQMSAGLRFTAGRFPWKDSPLLYWHPDLRQVLLEGPPLVAGPGERFGYSDYASLLLALVLERATGASLSRGLEDGIWRRVGAEHDATWSLDHEATGLELASSGFNATAIDLVKLASLYLDGGRWGGVQLLPERWVTESTRPPAADLPGHIEREVTEGLYYALGWWGQRLPGGGHCFYAHGYQGQILYACPDRRLVVARFGRRAGSVEDEWPALMRAIAERVP